MNFKKIFAILALMLASLALPKLAQAAFVMYVYESGSDVVASGSGSFNLAGASPQT